MRHQRPVHDNLCLSKHVQCSLLIDIQLSTLSARFKIQLWWEIAQNKNKNVVSFNTDEIVWAYCMFPSSRESLLSSQRVWSHPLDEGLCSQVQYCSSGGLKKTQRFVLLSSLSRAISAQRCNKASQVSHSSNRLFGGNSHNKLVAVSVKLF